MRETSVPGKQISTTGIQDLGEVAILDSMQFRCKERSLPRGRERRKNHRSEDLNTCLREGETRRRREKRQRPLRPRSGQRPSVPRAEESAPGIKPRARLDVWKTDLTVP